MDYSTKLLKIAKQILAYCKLCPDYKGGEGWCVYPHTPGTKVGPGTGWPKKPSGGASKQKCEQLAQNLASHGGSGGYKKKKKSTNPIEKDPIYIPPHPEPPEEK